MTDTSAAPVHLVLVTGNAGKVREVESILGFAVDRVDLDLPEIQSVNVAEVAAHKARAAWEAVGRPVIVEDTGLYLDALGGLPGALVRWFVKGIGPQGVIDLIPAGRPRGATARTAVALCDGGKPEVFTGEVRGTITPEPRGTDGFGWDPVFLPDGAPGTFAEMAMADKNRFSMRRLAVEHLRDRIQPRVPTT